METKISKNSLLRFHASEWAFPTRFHPSRGKAALPFPLRFLLVSLRFQFPALGCETGNEARFTAWQTPAELETKQWLPATKSSAPSGATPEQNQQPMPLAFTR